MKILPFTFFIVIVVAGSCNAGKNRNLMPDDDIKHEAVNTLRDILKNQQEWVKVHAAEFLIWTGHTQGVKEAYFKELEFFQDQPKYRIGIWRVLAQLSDGSEAEQYKKQILQAFLDTTGEDRIHAVETMAKLKMSPLPLYSFETREALNSDSGSFSAYTHWAVAYTNGDSLKAAKKYFLDRLLDAGEDILLRRIAAYVLRNSGSMNVEDWNRLSEMVRALPESTEGKISFLNAALLTAPKEVAGTDGYNKMFTQFVAFNSQKEKGVRMDMAAGLAETGTEVHLPLLTAWMRNTDPTGRAADDADVQAAAAYAILRIKERLTLINKDSEHN